MTGLAIAGLVLALISAAMLIAALVLIRSLSTKVDELVAKVKAASARQPTSELPAALEQRVDAIEKAVRDIPAAYGRLELSMLALRRDALSGLPSSPTPPTPTMMPTHASSSSTDPARWSPPSTGREELGSSASPIISGRSATGSFDDGLDQPVSPDDLIEQYRELIAKPRKNEITRWFDGLEAIPCEATDDNVFQTVDRGDGARLMLVQLTERFGLVLPSALMVVDFATSFSDVLSARSATRQTFALDTDGSGTLRLVEPAMAVLMDGNWKLKAPGRLAGLANG